ncbi:hypothetical protein AA106555_1750 [Neokomagataea thailandica NBRC 106555]|uniref:Cell division protein ZapA n=2 Tax=Neokomagataea TaxID=1223423 RepID=A0A4Y6V569_9PROT|nr:MULTISPECIES: cell division protein ZapA [Neokomagataea]QDH24028.1 cell division protein ZapA [Neokomagataea tanensis]GBR54644.1 hypothetical protein AA106555_1750 [Neokomagataea thailandica NBRC 106555]
MGQVSIRLNGYTYGVGCRDGEEPHLYDMAQSVEGWVQRARSFGGAPSEAKTLVMAALLMADEIHDLRRDIRALQKKVEKAEKQPVDAGAQTRKERLLALAETAESFMTQVENS